MKNKKGTRATVVLKDGDSRSFSSPGKTQNVLESILQDANSAERGAIRLEDVRSITFTEYEIGKE